MAERVEVVRLRVADRDGLDRGDPCSCSSSVGTSGTRAVHGAPMSPPRRPTRGPVRRLHAGSGWHRLASVARDDPVLPSDNVSTPPWPKRWRARPARTEEDRNHMAGCVWASSARARGRSARTCPTGSPAGCGRGRVHDREPAQPRAAGTDQGRVRVPAGDRPTGARSSPRSPTSSSWAARPATTSSRRRPRSRPART